MVLMKKVMLDEKGGQKMKKRDVDEAHGVI